MKKHSFIVLGTSAFTLACAQAILDSGNVMYAIVSLPKKLAPLNSVDVQLFASQNNIDYIECIDINNDEIVKKLSEYGADYIFSSWPRILTQKILDIPKRYCIGSHPTRLPFCRGRHPLHWAIILKLDESALSFFIMDQGIDTGDIILQLPFSLENNQSIESLNKKIVQLGYEGLYFIVENILTALDFRPKPQNHVQAIYLRKREYADCIIDPRMSVDSIIRLVRSYTLPYPCVKLIISKDESVSVWNAYTYDASSISLIEYREPGYIINMDEKSLILKVDDGVIVLETLEVIKANLRYIYPPTKYFNQ